MKISELDRRFVVARIFIAMAVGVMVVSLSGCLATWRIRENTQEIRIMDVDRTPADYPLLYQVDPGDVLTFFNHFGEDVVMTFPDAAIIEEDQDASKAGVQIFVSQGRKRTVTLTANPPQDDLGGGHLGFMVMFGPGHGGAKMIVEPPN